MSTRRGFFGSIFGGIAAAIRPRPAAPILDDHAQFLSLLEQHRAAQADYSGFEFVADPSPVCFVSENGKLVRVYPDKEPA